ncbi:MAG: AAA family ATPase [Solirubrobacterales bacterium]|nr:AAA family ATPase [Solirubrobacterales bacterium]
MGALFEREHELQTLGEGLGRARFGEGALLLIEGAPGVGKTELVREARAAAERAGMLSLGARGAELERQFAFGIVRQLLEPVVSKAPGSGDLFSGAARPAARLFESGEAPTPPVDAGFEALHSLYWLVVNLGDRGPLLVLVDDCQWADRESLRFLSYLAERIEGIPVALVLAARPPDPGEAEVAAFWSQIGSRPSGSALYPRPLSEIAAVALARERLSVDADEEFCRACHTATGGNPLFLRELLRALQAAGIVPSAVAANAVQAVGPAAVSRFVLHRLAALGPAGTELARAVAVLGDGSELELTAHLTGLTEETAREAADDLVRADIFVRGEKLGFIHPIVRSALYEDLLPGERHARHAAAADALAALGASPEQITTHLLLTTATGDQARVATLRSAAMAAAHRGAPGAAVTVLRRALAESPPEQERAEILAELGRCEVAAMDFEAAEEHLLDCVASDAKLVTRAEAASMLARCAVVSGGRSAEAAVQALASLAEMARPRDPERSLELASEHLIVMTAVPRLRGGLSAQLPRFRDQARGHPQFEAVAAVHEAQEQFVAGDPVAGVADAVEAALAAGLPPRAQTAAGFLALQLMRHGERYDVALRALDAVLTRAQSEGHTARQGLIHAQRAAIALARGSLQDAQVEAETGLRLVHAAHFAVMQLLAVAIVVHLERGALDDGLELARCGEALGVTEDRAYVVDFLTARGRLRIARGEAQEGVADLLWCGERLDALGVRWPSDWKAYAASALAALDRKALAATLAREQVEMARRVGAPGPLGLALRAAALAMGEDQRLELLQEAVSILELSQARLELAHALAELGSELTRLGRRREGRDAQRSAITLADECGAVALVERARAELQAGPGRRARLELTGRSALTGAEWRVCRQAVDGRTNREIAQALFITEKTVERHLSSAYQKLGIRSRFQLTSAIGE